jgi:anti-sigma B factor antagonist
VKISKRVIGSVAVLSLTGELNSQAARQAQAGLSRQIVQQEKVLLDLTNVQCLSSAGLRTMLLIYREARGLNHSVAVLGLSVDLLNVMQATGFLDFFVVVDSVEDGIALLNAERRKGRVLEYAASGS